jgi:DNA/RNA-binding domain of Phe-tRNA-synthetase-like protein
MDPSGDDETVAATDAALGGLAIAVAPHPLLDAGAFVTRLASPIGSIATPPAVTALAAAGARAPLASSDDVRAHVRALLRHGGYKPAGRGKPASEYLVGAAAEGRFPAINAGVDICNVVSLHSGLPISLVDLDRVTGALSIAIAPAGTTYAFNPSGQVIDASGLVCLFDELGPTGTAVKDAQRTKTHAETRATVTIVWGTVALPGRTAATVQWYRELLAGIEGAAVEDVVMTGR